ncbi:MAG: hypothetical protein JXR37_18585 [Kiritimatiellae bacterium]|nr:hypothetical protein [Kiritimatiellia bacterium]
MAEAHTGDWLIRDDGPVNWHVLHLRPRCEKKMADYCASLALEHYLPLREQVGTYQRRRVAVEKPLFPGYVFVNYRDDRRIELLRSNFIANILEVPDQRKLLDELRQIRLALQVDPTLGACAAFTRGKWAKILRGPFQGLEGVVQLVKGKARVVLNVELIGQGVAIEVDIEDLEALDGPT